MMLLHSGIFAQDDLLPDTTRTCYVDSLRLDAGAGFNNYLWSNGDTDQFTWVTQSGNYSVQASNDSITVNDSTYVSIFSGFLVSTDTVIDCGDSVVLITSGGPFSYLWEPIDSTDSFVEVYPRDTTTYFVTISDTDSMSYYCTDSVTVSLNTLIEIDTMMQLGMGCKGEDKGRIKFEVSGGYPGYHFDWPVEAIPLIEDSSSAFGLTDGTKTITITDSIGCQLEHEFEVEAFPLPELELEADPDTVYLQRPYITFSFENPQYDSLGTDTFYLNWSQWNFGDNDSSTLLSPTHTYKKAETFDVVLKFRTFFDCYGEDSIKVTVKPVNLKVPALITPNGDGANDYFIIWNDEDGGGGAGGENGGTTYKADEDEEIDLSEYYLSNSLVIFNRWGEKVYEVDNY